MSIRKNTIATLLIGHEFRNLIGVFLPLFVVLEFTPIVKKSVKQMQNRHYALNSMGNIC
jgi:hypothetical protein